MEGGKERKGVASPQPRSPARTRGRGDSRARARLLSPLPRRVTRIARCSSLPLKPDDPLPAPHSASHGLLPIPLLLLAPHGAQYHSCAPTSHLPSAQARPSPPSLAPETSPFPSLQRLAPTSLDDAQNSPSSRHSEDPTSVSDDLMVLEGGERGREGGKGWKEWVGGWGIWNGVGEAWWERRGDRETRAGNGPASPLAEALVIFVSNGVERCNDQSVVGVRRTRGE